jgi:hypothetical protein
MLNYAISIYIVAEGMSFLKCQENIDEREQGGLRESHGQRICFG